MRIEKFIKDKDHIAKGDLVLSVVRGHPKSCSEISKLTGIPKTTVRNKLSYLVRLNKIRLVHYWEVVE